MKEQDAQAKLSLKLQAYQYLKTKILNCEYRPNEFLNEQKLCAEMGNISRTPMRDALGRLEQEGLMSFQSLLLPEVVNDIASGQPMLALGLTDGLPENRVACGAAAGWLQGRNFILRSLYVAPQHRRWGGGRLLVETLCSLLTGYADSVEVSYTITRPEHNALLKNSLLNARSEAMNAYML